MGASRTVMVQPEGEKAVGGFGVGRGASPAAGVEEIGEFC